MEGFDNFPLLNAFSIPEGGLCGAFVGAAAPPELAQTSDPAREVGKDLREQHELTVPTTDELSPSHAGFDRRAMRKQTVTLEELGLPEEVVELPEYMQQEAIQKALEICPWASFTEFVEGGIMCFESSDDHDLWTRQANAGGGLDRGPIELFDISIVPSKNPKEEGLGWFLEEGEEYPPVRTKGADAGGGLESNDTVPNEHRPTKAEDEDGGQSMDNLGIRASELSSEFPGLYNLPLAERMAIRLAVMTDSDIAETPTDVLMDALDTIDNRRGGAQPTLEETGYRSKIMDELKNRGVEYKKARTAAVDDTVYQQFLDAMRGSGGSRMQENFDVLTNQMGLGGQQINELAQRLSSDGFEVEAMRKQAAAGPGRIAREILQGNGPVSTTDWQGLDHVISYAPAFNLVSMDDFHALSVAIKTQDEPGVRAALQLIADAFPGDESTEDLEKRTFGAYGLFDEPEVVRRPFRAAGRFSVSPPYHGESGSLWYVVDTQGDEPGPVDSARSPEEAETLRDQYERGEKVGRQKLAGAYPELTEIAERVADWVAREINASVQFVESAMPYKAQYTLEEVIRLLQERV